MVGALGVHLRGVARMWPTSLSSHAAYANLTAYMAERASSEGGVPFPSSAYYLDIYSFDNIFETGDTQ